MRFFVMSLAVAVCLSFARADAQEQPVIHVALSPFEAQANVYYAQELGLFKLAGLNIEIQQIQGSGAVVAAIVGGSVQIGTGSSLPMFSARERGIDLVLVAPGSMSDFADQRSGLVAAANSPIRTGRDLNGKIVGVNTLQSVDQVAISSWVDKTGGVSHTVKFLEVPGTLILDALSAGRIDAVLAVKNPEAAAAVLRKYLKTTTQAAHEQHARSLDPAMLQPLIDAAYKYNVLPKPLDVRDIIWHAG